MSATGALRRALGQLETHIQLVRAETWGYPVDQQLIKLVLPVRDLATVLPRLGCGCVDELAAFFTLCDGIELPDVYVGYFIESLERVVTGPGRGEPVTIGGPRPRSILVFGTDGGGGRFALDRGDGSILHLSSGGAVRGGTFVDEGGMTRVVTPTMADLVLEFSLEIQAQAAGVKRPHLI